MANFRLTLTRIGVDLRKVAPATRPKLESAAQLTLEDLIATAMRLAPKRTGTLRRSIGGSMVNPLRGEVHADAPYWSFVEYGTSRMSPRPYLRPTVAEVKPRARQRVLDAIAQGVKDAG